jgi:hypothetical protein
MCTWAGRGSRCRWPKGLEAKCGHSVGTVCLDLRVCQVAAIWLSPAKSPAFEKAQDAAMNIHINRSARRMSVRTIHLMLHLAQSCTGLMSTQQPKGCSTTDRPSAQGYRESREGSGRAPSHPGRGMTPGPLSTLLGLPSGFNSLCRNSANFLKARQKEASQVLGLRGSFRRGEGRPFNRLSRSCRQCSHIGL